MYFLRIYSPSSSLQPPLDFFGRVVKTKPSVGGGESVALYPGLPSQLFSQPWLREKMCKRPGCEASHSVRACVCVLAVVCIIMVYVENIHGRHRSERLAQCST